MIKDILFILFAGCGLFIGIFGTIFFSIQLVIFFGIICFLGLVISYRSKNEKIFNHGYCKLCEGHYKCVYHESKDLSKDIFQCDKCNNVIEITKFGNIF